jgi:hypothetical protein
MVFLMGCQLQMQAELGLLSSSVAHGFCHAGHEIFLNNPQTCWLSHWDNIPKGP